VAVVELVLARFTVSGYLYPMVTTLLFDLDGTLVDTEEIAIAVTARYFKARGIAVTDRDLKILVGHPWTPAVAHLLERYPLPLSATQVEGELLADYRKELLDPKIEIPGSSEAIRRLANDYRLALVSGSYRSDILLLLNSLQIMPYFSVILGCEDYHASKPSPVPYQSAMKALSVNSKECVVFEDSFSGLQSAKAAGIKTVGVRVDSIPEGAAPAITIRDFHSVSKTWLDSIFRD